MGIWGIEVRGNEWVAFSCEEKGRVRITQATLGIGEGVDKCSVQCCVANRCPVYLCALVPDKVETCVLELELEDGDELHFSVSGASRTVHLTGYYVNRNSSSSSRKLVSGVDIERNLLENIQNEAGGVALPVPSLPTHDYGFMFGGTGSQCHDMYLLSLLRFFKHPGREEKRNLVLLDEDDRETKKMRIQHLIGACAPDPDDGSRKKEEYFQSNCDKNIDVDARATEVNTLPNGLVIQDLVKQDHGKLAVAGRKLKVHYTGVVKENGKIVMSTMGGCPCKFRLGDKQVMDGFNIGIEGMRVGGKRRLTIPPSLAYGEVGVGEKNIPPNAWLVYEVELVSVRRH